MSLLLVGAGIAVTSTFFLMSPPPDAEAASVAGVEAKSERPDVPVAAGKIEKAIEKDSGDKRAKDKPEVSRGPDKKMLRVTIPKMDHIRNSRVPYADADDAGAFKKFAGVHLKGTGDPWDPEANVYIAGHRLGYPTTDSFLAFWDLNALGKGDRIFVTDADGKRYVYKVFRVFTVAPDEVSVTRPLEGRNILSLQTCTLPDYSRRLIVQAEKIVRS